MKLLSISAIVWIALALIEWFVVHSEIGFWACLILSVVSSIGTVLLEKLEK